MTFELDSWIDYYSKFIESFQGWEDLSANYKKRLTKKIKKFYWSQKIEEIEKMKMKMKKRMIIHPLFQ